MIVRLFRSNQLGPIVLLIVFSIIMWLISWKLHFKVVEPNGMPLYDLTLKLLGDCPQFVFTIIGFLLHTIQAFHLNFVLNKHEVFYKTSWLPALTYLIIAGLLPPFLWFSPVLIVNTILIFALDKIFRLYKNPKTMGLIFDSAFLCSLSTLVYLPAFVTIIVLGISILILRPFEWREWMIAILGCAIPFFLSFVYYFVNDEWLLFYNRLLVTGINKVLDISHLFTYEYTFSVVWILILFVLSVLRLQTNYYKNVTKSRLIQQLIIFILLLGFVSILVARDELLYRFGILSIPLGAYVSYFFLSSKKLWVAETAFWILIASWCYNYLFI